MLGLPLFIEESDFRAVHAAWIDSAVQDLRSHTADGVLDEEQLIRAARKGDVLHELAETLAKGPETRLPYGYSFTDKGGHLRKDVRLKWWNGAAKTWRDVAMSVPDLSQLPDDAIPPSLEAGVYRSDERPVFFGHYWLSGQPVLQALNAVCLDYSAGTDGPLVIYSQEDGEPNLALSNLSVHALQVGT